MGNEVSAAKPHEKQHEIDELVKASEKKDIEKIKKIIRRRTVNFNDVIQNSQGFQKVQANLLSTSLKNITEIAKELGAHKFDISSLFLISAQKPQWQEKIIKEMIKNGSNPNEPLFDAAEAGYFSVLKKLIKLGANVNLQNDDGDTVLHICCRQLDNRDIVLFLVDSGANLQLCNNFKQSPETMILDDNLLKEIENKRKTLDPRSKEKSLVTKNINQFFTSLKLKKKEEKVLDEMKNRENEQQSEEDLIDSLLEYEQDNEILDEVEKHEREEKKKIEELKKIEQLLLDGFQNEESMQNRSGVFQFGSFESGGGVEDIESVDSKNKKKKNEVENSFRRSMEILERQKKNLENKMNEIEKKEKIIKKEREKLEKRNSSKEEIDIKIEANDIIKIESKDASELEEIYEELQKKSPLEITDEELMYIKKRLENENVRLEKEKKVVVERWIQKKAEKKQLEELKKHLDLENKRIEEEQNKVREYMIRKKKKRSKSPKGKKKINKQGE